MADTALPAPQARSSRTSTRIAWGVLLAAFALFCVVCGLTLYGVNYFLFQSTVPMQVSLDVGRGTAAYLESSDTDENVAPQSGHFLSLNERIRLDLQSQATLFVHDPYRNNQLVASLTMKGGTSLYLAFALRPRFEWSSVDYRIDLTNVIGEVDVYVPEGLGRSLSLIMQTPESAFVYLTESGQYTVNASAAQVQISNHDGRAVLIAPGTSNGRLVAPGERGVMTLNDGYDVTTAPMPLNLLRPGEIQQMSIDNARSTQALLPDLVWPWQCGDSQSPPPGSYDIGWPEGRPAIRLLRVNATTHGETSCSQAPGPGQQGRHVTEFSSLILKASFYIENQSLAVCGTDGSECPLMFQLDYVFLNEDGEEETNIWYHGFYAKLDPSVSYPVRCSSCEIDHEPVYSGTWFTYESQNLFDIIRDELRPTRLLRLRFYASGHEYDVYVGDVALYAS